MFRLQGLSSRNPVRRLLYMLSVVKILLTYQPAVILIFEVFDYVPPALLYAKIFRKKVIIVTESVFSFRYFLSKFIYHYADQVLCASPTHIPIVKQFSPKRDPILLLNGTHAEPIDLVARSNKNYFQILSVGRLSPEKNLPTLIRSLSLLVQERSKLPKEIKLVIVGEGLEEGNLKQLVHELALEDYVYFLGKVSYDRKKEEYAAADVFVLPSFFEGFPLVIAEA